MKTVDGPKRSAPIPPDRLAEAGVWIARLHGDDRNEAMEIGFREWLKADPMNERAFELSTDVWEDSLNLRRVVPFAHEIAKPRTRLLWFSLPSLALASAAALLIAVVSIHFFRGTVATGIGEQRLLALEDGSRVFLNTATRVVVRYSERVRLVELESGEALFDVAKDADRPFIVQVGDRQVRALDTSFVMRRDKEQLAVTLVEGKVAVTQGTLAQSTLAQTQIAAADLSRPKSATRSNSVSHEIAGSGEVFMLMPGQRLVIPQNRPVQVDTQSVEKAVAWRRGQVLLDDTPLASAVVEMNRYNAKKLVIQTPDAGDLIVNGLFQAGDSMSFANAVSQTFGLQVVESRDEIVLSGVPR